MNERALSALANVIIINETCGKATVTYSWGSAKKPDRKKGVREAKSLGISDLDNAILVRKLQFKKHY